MSPVPRPKVPAMTSKKAGDPKAAYSSSNAMSGYNPPMMGGNSLDHASSWMQSKGLKNAQNGGKVGRLPYATVPADRLTAGSNTLKSKSQVAATPKPAKRTTSKSSSGPTKSRVKTQYTGKSYKTPSVKRTVTRKARVIGA